MFLLLSLIFVSSFCLFFPLFAVCPHKRAYQTLQPQNLCEVELRWKRHWCVLQQLESWRRWSACKLVFFFSSHLLNISATKSSEVHLRNLSPACQRTHKHLEALSVRLRSTCRGENKCPNTSPSFTPSLWFNPPGNSLWVPDAESVADTCYWPTSFNQAVFRTLLCLMHGWS